MPKVTAEIAQQMRDAGCFTPRHQSGCPKNWSRTLPLVYAAHGATIEEIKAKAWSSYNHATCTCEK